MEGTITSSEISILLSVESSTDLGQFTNAKQVYPPPSVAGDMAASSHLVYIRAVLSCVITLQVMQTTVRVRSEDFFVTENNSASEI